MSNKKNKGKNKADKKLDSLKYQIRKLITENPGKLFSPKQIIRKLNIKQKHLKKNVESILDSLMHDEYILSDNKGRYGSNRIINEITGQVDYVNPRYAYIVSDEVDEDVYVRTEDMHQALDDDIVKVRLTSVRKDGRPLGVITEILRRHRLEFVGRVESGDSYAFVIPDFKKMHFDFFVRKEGIKKAHNNDKVIVRLVDWKDGDKNPLGEVVKVLGPAGDHDVEIYSIMAEFGLPYEFLGSILKQSGQIEEKITQADIKIRRDFRDVTTFTIDPEDAKDFDDAISLKLLENGHYEVGVHIADVSHYVTEGSALDQEAYKRSTSVYLVDRTIPMLPERLSNDLCSLRPGEDKLTFSAVFELDPEARVINEWFGKTIIHSDRRFTYDEAQERIETGKGDFVKELTRLNELALKLRDERFQKGSINFETPEVKFRLDEKGKPLEIIPKVRKDAHKLIEDYMLLANKKVAEWINRNGKSRDNNTFVYRIHDQPDQEKLETFRNFAKKFGHQINIQQEGISRALNNLLKEIEGKPEQNILENLAIRSMAKAKYSTERKGHFGLAFRHYTHFTSPIRRYPDMMVHRLLYHYLQKGKPPDNASYEKKCVHCSDQEKTATDAERASVKYKQVEYMKGKIGDSFEGLISGVTDWGIYVEIIDIKIEGMVRVSDMEDDYYEFDEKNMRVIGRNNKRMYTLGDPVKVRVLHADIDRRIIDLVLIQDE